MNDAELTLESTTAEVEVSSESEWSTPDFVEQNACAEICAYVFSA